MVGLARLLTPEVLEQERHAPERAVGELTLRVSARPIELPVDHGVDLRIKRLDPGDRRLDELARVHVALGHELGEPGGVVVVEEIAHQFGIRPPLTMIVWPETKAESSERK